MLNNFISDLKASIVVFLVALPLCLGIALASNAPLSSGIIAGIIGGILIGAVSNSHISVSGPAAGLTVIVASGISSLGDFATFTVAVFFAGIFQIIFSLLRGGVVGDYFPNATIKGMLSAIGVILIMKQLPNAIGLEKGNYNLQQIDRGVFLISFVSLSLMILWDKLAMKGLKFFKLIPGALVAVVLSIILNQLFFLIGDQKLVSIPLNLFGDFKVTSIYQMNWTLLQMALTLAIVASLETLLCVDAADRIDLEKRITNKNRELFAQGLGNALSGFLGGLPVTAVIVRTSANLNAGAKTKLSAILHGVWLLLCVYFIPDFLNKIPLATLACVLLLVGYKLTKPSFFIEMKNKGWDQFFVFTSTIVAILATDLLKGIFLGLIVAIVFEIKKINFHAIEISSSEKIHTIHLKSDVTFFHKAKILKLFRNLDSEIKLIKIILAKNIKIHPDVSEVIDELKKEANLRNIEVEIL